MVIAISEQPVTLETHPEFTTEELEKIINPDGETWKDDPAVVALIETRDPRMLELAKRGMEIEIENPTEEGSQHIAAYHKGTLRNGKITFLNEDFYKYTFHAAQEKLEK